MMNSGVTAPRSHREHRGFPILLFIILFLSLAFLPAPAYSISAEATLSAQETGVGEPVKLVVRVSTDEKTAELPWPKVGGQLDAFTVSKSTGTTQSSQTTIVNGKVTRSTSYVTQFVFELTPKKEGTFPIGPISYEHGDFRRDLGSAVIKVVKTEAGMEIRTLLSKRKLYVGEQVRYVMRVVPKSSVHNIKAPNIGAEIGKKFFIRQMDEKIEPKVITEEGRRQKIYDIRYAMFPLLSGDITLPSLTLDYEEVVARRGRPRTMFDEFFGGGRTVAKKASSQAVTLNVVPVPDGAPAHFTGAVGDYSLKAAVDKTQLPSGDALTLTVTISGNGQPKAITGPKLPELSAFEVFDPETQTNTQIKNGMLHTTKKFTYVLIPVRKGEYTIEAIQFAYLDPAGGAYKNATSDRINISVSQGKEMAGSGTKFLTQKEIETFGSDIRHIKPVRDELKDMSSRLYQTPAYWAAYLLGPILFCCAFAYRSRQQKLGEDRGLLRKTKAKSYARKRLTQAHQALSQDDARVFYKHLATAVERFVSDKLNFELRGMLRADAVSRLKEHNIPESESEKLMDFLELCDRTQFAGTAKDRGEWRTDYDRAENLINTLNKRL